MRKAFNFYKSYWDVANELNDNDRLAFYDALLKRQFTGQESELNGMSKFAMLSQKHSIDLQIDGYLSQWRKNHPNEDPWQGGVEGGNIGAYKDPYQQEKGKEKVKDKVKQVFKIPTFENVQSYCVERKNNVDARKFIDFYESKGWMVGKNKMKDWKACVRTWEKTSTVSTTETKDYDQLYYENVMKQINQYK
jgi:hypothetical protein